MQRNIYKDDFEQLVKQKADQYKMYPSERVWKGIYRSLHSRRRWYLLGAGFVFLLSGISYYAIEELLTPSQNKPLAKTVIPQPGGEKGLEKKPFAIPFVTTINSSSKKDQKSSVDPSIEVVANSFTNDLTIDNVLASNLSPEKEYLHISKETIATSTLTETMPEGKNSIESRFTNRDYKNNFELGSIIGNMVKGADLNMVKNTFTLARDISDQQKDEDEKKINWLQEYAVYELTAPRLKRLSWQLSFSPTMNYRRLVSNNKGNIASEAKNIPIALDIQGDIDHLVNHKPALGFELGTHFLYAVNKIVTLKAGVQFNYSRYDILAYSSYYADRATIALTNLYGYNSDSITTYTRFRNFGGHEREDLPNQYFQISAPVGVELRLLGSNRLQLSIATTLQPTYLLNRNTYLITTDYKNYTKEPSLVRKWNVNTAAEAFISYKAGGLKWQVGPQFRYQLLSSYVDKYPIKEYLLEYGIKVGISKTIR